MKMSISSSGCYNFEPNCVYEKDGYLCYEINDEYYRMVYHIKYVDGNLEGFYMQHGKETPVKYVKIDDIPEDAPFQYAPTEIYVPKTDKTRIEILKQCAEYDRSKEYGFDNEFVLGGDIPPILENYKYSEYIKDLDSNNDEIVFKLLDFVCDHFGHDGCGGSGAGRSITALIECCEKNNHKSNCRGLAILLASLLRLYLKDKEDEYVSLPRLRELLLADEPIFENATASYNGTKFEKEDHRNYMIKNMCRFARCTLNKEGVDGRTENSRYIDLIPKNYPVENFSEEKKADFVYNDIGFWKM